MRLNKTNRMGRWMAAAVCLAPLVAASCRPTRPASAPAPAGSFERAALRPLIDSLAGAPEFANAHWGILIVDPESGDTLYARNAGTLFMPASNMKILTSAIFLDHVGPGFRFKTSVAARGTVAEGTLVGDLLVVGRGDPSVSDHMQIDAMTPLRAMAESIATHGVRHVTGRLVAAGNAFPDETLGYGWSYDDFEDSYSAPIDELLFNEGFSELHVHAGARPGDPVRVDTRPARSFPRVRVNATTVPRRQAGDTLSSRARALRVRKDSATWEVFVEGEIAAGDSAVIEVTHRDPDAAYLAGLREALAERGISFDNARSDTTARVDTLFALLSPTLREILPALLKPSQNQIAEMLYKASALAETGIGRADSARAVEQRQLTRWGVAPSEVVVRDGSGLSRYDYLSPRTVVRVLDAMRRSPNFSAFYDALPIGGVDGTIKLRMRGTAAEGNVHAKTGTLAMARSLSGYVTTADHRMLIFSVLCNNWTAPVRSVERVQDTIAARLASMRLR